MSQDTIVVEGATSAPALPDYSERLQRRTNARSDKLVRASLENGRDRINDASR